MKLLGIVTDSMVFTGAKVHQRILSFLEATGKTPHPRFVTPQIQIPCRNCNRMA
jgi:hypothetical protein